MRPTIELNWALYLIPIDSPRPSINWGTYTSIGTSGMGPTLSDEVLLHLAQGESFQQLTEEKDETY